MDTDIDIRSRQAVLDDPRVGQLVDVLCGVWESPELVAVDILKLLDDGKLRAHRFSEEQAQALREALLDLKVPGIQLGLVHLLLESLER